MMNVLRDASSPWISVEVSNKIDFLDVLTRISFLNEPLHGLPVVLARSKWLFLAVFDVSRNNDNAL